MVVSLNATLFLAASSCLEVLFVVKILHTVFNQTHGIQAAVVRRVKSCLSWPRNCGNHIRYLLFRRSLVNDEVARLQVSWSRGFLVAYAFLSMSSLLSVQRNVLLDRARWMSPIFTWTNVLVFGCLTLYVLFPSLLSTRTLNRFYVVGMILAAAYLSPWHTGTDEMFDMALILFVCCRLPAVILCARTSLVFLCNLGFTVLTIYRASTEEMASEGTFASRYVILWTELTMCAVTVAFSFALLSVLTRKAELQVQGCNAETHFTAASTLLGLMCDAVVELDSNFCLTEHSKALAAVLLKSSNIQGASLMDFMPVDDADRAMQHFRALSGDAATVLAHAFHTRLVDSCSTKLETEVFQVKYTRMNGEQCHLVGLREFSDAKFGSAERPEDNTRCILPQVADSQVVNVRDEPSDGRKHGSMLEIDMAQRSIIAASGHLCNCVGMSIEDVFPVSHTIQLLQRLHQEAESLDEEETFVGKVYYFDDLPARLYPEGVQHISGMMQLTRSFQSHHPGVVVVFSVTEADRKQSHQSEISSQRSTKIEI